MPEDNDIETSHAISLVYTPTTHIHISKPKSRKYAMHKSRECFEVCHFDLTCDSINIYSTYGCAWCVYTARQRAQEQNWFFFVDDNNELNDRHDHIARLAARIYVQFRSRSLPLFHINKKIDLLCKFVLSFNFKRKEWSRERKKDFFFLKK